MNARTKDYGGRFVVLLGRRKGALRAARSLGLEVVLVDDGRQITRGGRAEVGLGALRFDDPPEAWSGLADRLARGEPPAAVLGLTERAVLPAAHLRRALGIRGAARDDVTAAIRATDKAAMKRAARACGISTAEWLEGDDGPTRDEMVERLGLPVVVKPRAGSGTRGTRMVPRAEDLPDRLPPGWLAESWTDGTEMSVESLVQDGVAIFTNFTEYFRPGWANILPQVVEPHLRAALLRVNEATLSAIGVRRGMTHLEVFLTARGIVLGEMAWRPPGGHILELIRLAYGFDPWEALLRTELGETPTLPHEARRTAGTWLWHPGAGRVRAVRGVAEAREMPGVRSVVMTARPGKVLTERLGVGQEAGHVIVTGPDHATVARDLARAHAAVRIEMESSRAARTA